MTRLYSSRERGFPLLELYCSFRAIVRDFKPDIVAANFPMWQSLPVEGAFYFPHRWRLIVTLHGSDIAGVPVEQPKLQR